VTQLAARSHCRAQGCAACQALGPGCPWGVRVHVRRQRLLLAPAAAVCWRPSGVQAAAAARGAGACVCTSAGEVVGLQ
jgi:hypothetical protein